MTSIPLIESDTQLCRVDGCMRPASKRGEFPQYCMPHSLRMRDRKSKAKKRVERAAQPASEPPLPVVSRSLYGDRHSGLNDSLTVMIVDHVTGTFYTGTLRLTLGRVMPADPDSVAHQIRAARLVGTLVVERTHPNADWLASETLPHASDNPARTSHVGAHSSAPASGD